MINDLKTAGKDATTGLTWHDRKGLQTRKREEKQEFKFANLHI